jgi:ABC-2 type transport system ATP-binding protein
LLLQVVSLTKRYGHFTALSEVSFSIRPGEVLGLIGPNGSGKTTLFECLGSVLPADGGSVLRDGRPLTPAERKATMFYLPDAITPWPAQTVRWALEFMQGFFGVRPGHEDDRGLTPTLGLIRELQLEPLLDSPIGTLSKGQRKRTLLALGLLAPQPILLADEPFEGLDLRQTRAAASTLRAHAGGERTLFLSIHQINDAARACDRFVLLSGGRVRGEGTWDELSLAAAARGTAAADLEEVFLALT